MHGLPLLLLTAQPAEALRELRGTQIASSWDAASNLLHAHGRLPYSAIVYDFDSGLVSLPDFHQLVAVGLPVVVVARRLTSIEWIRLFRQGAAHVLRKPTSVEEILRCLGPQAAHEVSFGARAWDLAARFLSRQR